MVMRKHIRLLLITAARTHLDVIVSDDARVLIEEKVDISTGKNLLLDLLHNTGINLCKLDAVIAFCYEDGEFCHNQTAVKLGYDIAESLHIPFHDVGGYPIHTEQTRIIENALSIVELS
ncbi:hypothetical protein [Brevibacillus dissolubilis]|uniref:hypothetical protein n=1 Tax=Brevibacillus dissolubilis TaxID=1844116 RepID=UPI00111671EB|nr:hypothetical protein [Brevibacillus dissolubilis]